MNWDLIKWVAGVLLTFAGIKFVWVFLRSMLNRDNMEDAIEAIGSRIKDAGSGMANYAKRKAKERKARKEEQKPMIIIR